MTLLRTPRLAGAPDRGIPDATVARLPLYLRVLASFADAGATTCSSVELAEAAGVNPAKVRKDLSHLGSYGTRGVGYDVEYLSYQIARGLGQTHTWDVVIVGAGNLGSALSTYQGFSSRGIDIAAVVDTDPARVGTLVGDVEVRPYAELADLVHRHGVKIAVLAVPGEAAQAVADDLVSAGVTSILNFAPAVLQVPDSVVVRKVDLSVELQILAYHEQRKDEVDETFSGSSQGEVAAR